MNERTLGNAERIHFLGREQQEERVSRIQSPSFPERPLGRKGRESKDELGPAEEKRTSPLVSFT